MPRVHTVEKARKAYPEYGIAVGDTYYHWKPRYGGVRKSKTYPRRSQLTGSDFLATVFDIFDRDIPECEDPDSLREIAERLREAGQECEDRRCNMPDALQESDTGQLLQTRYDACEEAAQACDEAADAWEQAIEAARAIDEPDWG